MSPLTPRRPLPLFSELEAEVYLNGKLCSLSGSIKRFYKTWGPLMNFVIKPTGLEPQTRNTLRCTFYVVVFLSVSDAVVLDFFWGGGAWFHSNIL